MTDISGWTDEQVNEAILAIQPECYLPPPPNVQSVRRGWRGRSRDERENRIY